MNWNQILTEVILSVAGIIISALGLYLTYFINKKIKNEELKEIVNSLNELIKNSVLEVYQTYVEALKDNGMFDKKAQKLALERCLTLINTNMPERVKTWLKSNFTDIERYLKSLIEAQIALLKNGGK